MLMVDDIWDRITVVLCVKNSAHVLPLSLATLPKAKRIIVVDAISTDCTPEVAITSHPAVEVIHITDDKGLANATNIGFAKANTEFVLNINPDTLFEEGTVEQLVATADENPNAAGIAPLLINGRGNQELDVMGPWEYNHHKMHETPAGPFCTWFITGAIVLWRHKAYCSFGGMDESFFLYNEDADLCNQSVANGFSLILEPRAKSTHLGGASERVTLKTRRQKDWNMTWGHLFYVRKYGSPEKADEIARNYVQSCSIDALKGLITFRPKKVVGNLAMASAARHYLQRRTPWGRANRTWKDL
jgi:N-acetylglucosaminyl-diphospho-decaprenol L-rhamnosyltransferase